MKVRILAQGHSITFCIKILFNTRNIVGILNLNFVFTVSIGQKVCRKNPSIKDSLPKRLIQVFNLRPHQ